MSPRKVSCHHCEGWGCTHCELERQARVGGKQGLTAAELEFEQVRAERDAALKRVTELEAAVVLLQTGKYGTAAISEERDAWQVRCLKAEAALHEAREDRDEERNARARLAAVSEEER